MSKKNIPSARLTAIGGNGASSTSSDCKNNHFLEKVRQLHFVKDHSEKLCDAFSNNIITRLQAEMLTGIRTSSVCPFVKSKKNQNAIWSCGQHKDPCSGHLAEYLTMNRALAVEYYKNETAYLWQDLPQKGQQDIEKAIDAYLQQIDYGVFISSALEDSVREVWLKVQDHIDVKMAIIRSSNVERRKSICLDL